MSAIAPGMIIFAYLCGSISSAILVCRLLDCRTRATAALGIRARQTCCASVAGSRRRGTDFRRPERYVTRLGCLCARRQPLLAGIDRNRRLSGNTFGRYFRLFKGGKGVATAFGAIAPIGWDLTGVMAGTRLPTVLLSGYSSLGAIVSALIAPFTSGGSIPSSLFRCPCCRV